LGRAKLFGLLAVMVLTACPPAEKRKAIVQPPPAAWAPQPLPLPSYEPLLRSGASGAPDAIDVLISQVEQVYANGMSDYRAGNLEKAKDQFDKALSLLLGSNLDLESDERLSVEFDRLVENIHSAELAALERGDTLSAHKYEPAPIESFSGLTFPVDPKIKQRVQQEVNSVRADLPMASNDYVAGALTYLQGRGSGYVNTVLKRVGLYQPIIGEALRKEALPQDLIYLAAAESAFNPFALSRARAKGIWQFMLGRAIEYGLKRDRWVDEREDPVKSTQAAARHLKDLYQQFGDWFLAMAAYNCGPVNVQKAIEKTGYADYWTLRQLHALPADTENYVPVILATALIAKDPRAYGFDVQPDPPLIVDQVAVSAPTDLRLVAQLLDRPVEELIRLNPSLLRWTTPANNPQFVLNLPQGTKEAFEQAIAAIPEDKRIWWRAYKVGDGETVASVAKKFRVSAMTLAEVNQIKRDAMLEEGVRLVLPMAPGNEASLQRVRERGSNRLYRYRIKSGDTVELIADRFDVTPYQIRRWNKLKTSRLVPGRTLRLYVAMGGGGSSQKPRAQRPGKSRRSTLAKKTTQRGKAATEKTDSKAPARAPSPVSLAPR